MKQKKIFIVVGTPVPLTFQNDMPDHVKKIFLIPQHALRFFISQPKTCRFFFTLNDFNLRTFKLISFTSISFELQTAPKNYKKVIFK